MTLWERFIDNIPLRRFVVLLSVVIILVLAKSMMSIILLTFIFSFLIVKLTNFIRKYVRLPAPLIVSVTYVVIIVALFAAITQYLPQLVVQTVHSVNNLITFYSNPKNLPNDQVIQVVNEFVNKNSIFEQLKNGVGLVWTYVKGVGHIGVTLFLSLMMSFFFTLETKTLTKFSKLFLTSDFAWYFQDLYFFGAKFVRTFGVVIEVQFLIALVNTAITTVVLAIMQMPQLMALSIMVFICSLIPVAGVIVSFVPLALVGYSVGGFQYVLYLLITIVIVHILEAYVLNPRFMASRTNLPIFYTFVVLIVAEHFFGTWGLICGVPVFTFLLDIIGVQSQEYKLKKIKPPMTE